MEQYLKKISIIFLALTVLTVPSYSHAQERIEFNDDGTARVNAQGQSVGYTDSSADAPLNNDFDNKSASNLSDGASCLMSTAFASNIKQSVGNLLGSTVSGFTSTEVPVSEGSLRNKEIGGTTGGSLDSLGFCLVNTMISYITQSTIAWANSGFQGSPVFVEDPAHFFQSIADIEAGKFITEITGSDLFCAQFRPQININIAARFNTDPMRMENVCTISERVKNVENFVNGLETGSFDDYFKVTSNPRINPHVAPFVAQDILNARILEQQHTAELELGWGNGFLSFKDESGNISTPGSVIEKQINDRLGSGQRRIEMADEFDELVSAVLDSLIRVAIQEVF